MKKHSATHNKTITNYVILQSYSFDSDQTVYGPFSSILEARSALKCLFDELVDEELNESDSFRPEDSHIETDGDSALLVWDDGQGGEDTETIQIVSLDARFGASLSVPVSKGHFVAFVDQYDDYRQAGLLFRDEDDTLIDLALAEEKADSTEGFRLLEWGDVHSEDYTSQISYQYKEISESLS